MSVLGNIFILHNMKQFYMILLCHIKLIYIHLNHYVLHLYLIVPQTSISPYSNILEGAIFP